MTFFRHLVFPFLVSLIISATATAAAPLRIAAAADLATCMPSLIAGFDGEASVTVGASGNFYAQIRNGAPFDILMSADTGYPQALADAGLADRASMVVYALGQLVLWSADPRLDTSAGLALMTDPAVRRIAIASPEVAPYGRAAKAALQQAGLWDRLQQKLVYGENVAQTMQFVESGNAQLGLVSKAHVKESPNGWVLPGGSYPALEQGAIVTARGNAHPAAARYLHFLRSERGRALLAACGFLLPPARP
jgi:molybdate transport system substrate-binding protein